MGDIEAGLSDYRAVLETSRALDLRIGIANGLEYMAEVSIWAGDAGRAARLGAAAARIKDDLGGGVPPRIGGALDPLEAAKTLLPSDEYDRDVASGREMAIDTAIDEALAVSLAPGSSIGSAAGAQHGQRATG